MTAQQENEGLDAPVERARKLLGGGASPADAMAAIQLVDDAAAQGDVDALTMVAVFHALGAMREQSWARAFDTLRLAAERGSEVALRQLRLLAGQQDDDAATAEPAELAESIDVASLLRAQLPTALSTAPLIQELKNFANAAECRWLIERTEPRLAPAAVWDDRGARVDQHRSNSAIAVTVADTDVVVEVIRARISHALQLPVALFEPPQMLHYSVGQEFVPHFDFLDPQHPSQAAAMAEWGQRMGTFLIYLNGGFEGGETEFPRVGLSYRGTDGDALFFANVTRDGRPDPLTLHAGRPPTSGEKWVMSTWIRDRTPGSPA